MKKKFKDLGLDGYVLGAVLYIVGWSIVFFIAWLVIREEPAVLEGCILTPGVVELGYTAWLRSNKRKYDKENKDERYNLQDSGADTESDSSPDSGDCDPMG